MVGNPTHLVAVISLLDELVDDLLRLAVTLLLQVDDQGVEVARAVVRLHDGLVGLHHTGDAWEQIVTRHERSYISRMSRAPMELSGRGDEVPALAGTS